MANSYVIASGKGGTGKTTTAVNLGAAMNKLDEDVVILDANLSTPNLGLYFGAPLVPVNLNHALRGDADIEETIYEHESGVKIIPASLSPNDLKKVKISELKNSVAELKKISKNILIDCAAGLEEEAKQAIKAADKVILVVNPNILSVTGALKTIKVSEDLGKTVRGAIITRVQRNRKSEMSISNIKEMLEVPILGVIPEDKHVGRALNKKDAVIHTKPRSKASKAYQKIAEKLIGKKQKTTFYGKIMEALR